jgi:PAS domain-containing protein
MGSASPPEVIERCFDSATEHFMNAVTESFALIDQEGRVVRANIAYRRLTGPAGGAHDASIISYIEPERREALRETLRALNDKTMTRTLQLRFRIGHDTRLIESELTWMGPEGLISFVGRDVTKQDLLERERQETAAARDAVEQVGDIGHWRAGRDFKLQCSQGAARILGLDPAAPPLVLRTVVTVAAAAAVVATEYATLTLARSDRRALDGAALTEVTVTLAAGKPAAVATAPVKAL